MPPRAPLTHFLCLPLINATSKPQFQSSLQHFAASVTVPDDAGNDSISMKAIRPVGTLHLTLGVMSLQSKNRVEAAVAFLHSLDARELLKRPAAAVPHDEDSGTGVLNVDETVASAAKSTLQAEEPLSPLVVSLKGLHPMHSPSSTSILYTSPQDHSLRLQSLCEALRTAFTEAGFLVPETRPLLLHATIVNTLYAKERGKRPRGGGHGKEGKGKRGFDARRTLESYRDYIWAEGIRLEKIAICEMGARRVNNEEGFSHRGVSGAISTTLGSRRLVDDIFLSCRIKITNKISITRATPPTAPSTMPEIDPADRLFDVDSKLEEGGDVIVVLDVAVVVVAIEVDGAEGTVEAKDDGMDEDDDEDSDAKEDEASNEDIAVETTIG
ncbi:hypothetical protein MMC13_005151 [Lambiella insularis]|nr:hypothetical protein [Lambiella insularis]